MKVFGVVYLIWNMVNGKNMSGRLSKLLKRVSMNMHDKTA